MRFKLIRISLLSIITIVCFVKDSIAIENKPGKKSITYSWTQKSSLNSPELLLLAPSMVYDSDQNRIVLFGGNDDQKGSMNNTWEFNKEKWTKIETLTKPTARFYAAMSYHAVQKKVVLFGGKNSGDVNKSFNDTWEFDGKNWIQIKPKTSPPPRSNHSMVYDSDRKVTVLFGGSKGDTLLNDLWEWDGKNWNELTSQIKPQPRSFHSIAYDEKRKVIVLFGGYADKKWNDNDLYFENDIWEWNGKEWIKKEIKSKPLPRSAFGFVYSSALQKTILFGGLQRAFKYGTASNDTWAWDGTSWAKLSPVQNPSSRIFFQMCYDSKRQVIVLFGGWTSKEGLKDIWEFGAS